MIAAGGGRCQAITCGGGATPWSMLSLLRHFMPEAAKTAKWPENRVFGLAAPPHSIFRPFSAVMIIIERIGLWRDGVNGAPTWQRAAICAHGEGGASTQGTREGRPRRTRSRRNACGLCRCWRRLRGTDRNGTPKACPPWRGLVGQKMIKNLVKRRRKVFGGLKTARNGLKTDKNR